MNMKGYNHFGLERYEGIEAINIRTSFKRRSRCKSYRSKCRCNTCSQVVTQKNVHIPNLTQLVELLEAEGLRDKVILVCGAPRIS